MSQTPTKPAALQEGHLLFLDAVRESGAINMFGAAAPLRDMFDELTRAEAREIHAYWMATFAERHGKVKTEASGSAA